MLLSVMERYRNSPAAVALLLSLPTGMSSYAAPQCRSSYTGVRLLAAFTRDGLVLADPDADGTWLHDCC